MSRRVIYGDYTPFGREIIPVLTKSQLETIIAKNKISAFTQRFLAEQQLEKMKNLKISSRNKKPHVFIHKNAVAAPAAGGK